MNRSNSGGSNTRYQTPSSSPVQGARLNSIGTLSATLGGSSNATDEPYNAEGDVDPEDGPLNFYEEAFANLATNAEIPEENEGAQNL